MAAFPAHLLGAAWEGADCKAARVCPPVTGRGCMIRFWRNGRMRAWRAIVATVLASGGGIAALALAGPPSAPPIPPATRPAAEPTHTVDSLIDEILTRLAHDNWRVRETAEAELADLAELAVPRLRALAAG